MVKTDTVNVTTAQARKTALLVAAVAALAACFFFYRGRSTAAIIAGSITAALTVTGLFIPPLAVSFHRIWMRFAYALGYVNSRIILTAIYFLVFVPYGLVSRLLGRDPLGVREEGKNSYWHKREATRQDKDGFERLF